jgi:hypothetical protein
VFFIWLNTTKEMIIETGLTCKGLITTFARKTSFLSFTDERLINKIFQMNPHKVGDNIALSQIVSFTLGKGTLELRLTLI